MKTLKSPYGSEILFPPPGVNFKNGVSPFKKSKDNMKKDFSHPLGRLVGLQNKRKMVKNREK